MSKKSFEIPDKVIYVCTGSKCKKKGGKDNGKLLRECIKRAGLEDKVEVIKTDCTDRCDFAPVMAFQPENFWMHHVTEEQAMRAFQDHVILKPNTPPGIADE